MHVSNQLAGARTGVCVLRGMMAGAGKLRFFSPSHRRAVEPRSSRAETASTGSSEPRFSWFGLYGLYGETVVTNAVCVILFYPFLTLRIHTPFPRWTPLTHFATALLQIPRYFSRWGPLRAKVWFVRTSFPICSLIREFEKIPRPIKSPFPESVAFQEPSRRREKPRKVRFAKDFFPILKYIRLFSTFSGSQLKVWAPTVFGSRMGMIGPSCDVHVHTIAQ